MASNDRPLSRQTVLMTGASSDTGFELAREFARHEHPLILVAPVATELGELTKELHADFGVPVTPIVADLADGTAAEKIFQLVNGSGARVDILVNNAGLGQHGKFWEIPVGKDLEMIRLNIEVALRLTKLFLPLMVQRGGGRVLNLASLAGGEPGPLTAVYHATKAFVLSWSQAIATELEPTGVTVTALCVGPMDADFLSQAGPAEGAALHMAGVMPPEEIAKIARAATMKGERVVIPGGPGKATIFPRRVPDHAGPATKAEKFSADGAARDHARAPEEIRTEAATKER